MNKIVEAYTQLSGNKKGFWLQEDAPRLFIRNKMYGIEIAHSKFLGKGHSRIMPEFIQTDDKCIMYYSGKRFHTGIGSALILYKIPLRYCAMYGLFYAAGGRIYDVMFTERLLYEAIVRILTEHSEHAENPVDDFEELFEEMRRQNVEALNDLYLSGENIE